MLDAREREDRSQSVKAAQAAVAERFMERKMMSYRIARVLFILLATLVLAAGASLILAGKPGGGCPRPRAGCICPEVYDPVTCDGGCTYSNQCFASCAGAKNCVPSGGGPTS